MKNETMQTLQENSFLSAGSDTYLESIYELYLTNPDLVTEAWREYFDRLPQNGNFLGQDSLHSVIRDQFVDQARHPRMIATGTSVGGDSKQSQVQSLIHSYRKFGHYAAQLDPLGLMPPKTLPELNLEKHGLSNQDLEQVFTIANSSLFTSSQVKLAEIIQALKNTYCRSIGFQYLHIDDENEVNWLAQRIEANQGMAKFNAAEKQQILKLLTQAEGLEKYLATRYVGQKRFSLEGGESLIPLVHETIHRGSAAQVKEFVIGMAHRGRLNVLINILGKAPANLFQEFEGHYQETSKSGDVKYHLGYSSNITTENGLVHVALGFNPSHLEIISPVVEGSVYARLKHRSHNAATHVLPLIVHGDAAVAGQGVVMETINMSQLQGFHTGGTVHVVINNQVGFTTDPSSARSTPYCTDIARMVQIPVFHVNGDDPEAVVFVTQLALDYRMKFQKDVMIDLICYRRHGHNEADEPSATQPRMYHIVKKHPTTRAIYADKLAANNTIASTEANNLAEEYRKQLDAGDPIVRKVENSKENGFLSNWKVFADQKWQQNVDTTLTEKQIKTLASKITVFPKEFTLQAQVAKEIEQRAQMLAGKLPLNWGAAETLAYARLLVAGYPIRLSGQDSGRGTFAHRHAELHDQNSDAVYVPLQHIDVKQAEFSVINSILSEEAVLGFEYGYACTEPNALVIWEAQFGDFANGAQVVIDQFISSGEQKWNRLCGLTLYLPHGYEGMGPEHSSARLERYLQLCAQENMQVCVPSTPAQHFHMISRQMIRPYRKPLIVMTPKSLLRHKLAVSNIQEFIKGSFQNVIPEVESLKDNNINRVILCSGKVYYDLINYRHEHKLENVAIIRIEQLYPFPETEVMQQLQRYAKAKSIVWCQEEPRNQGAWYFIQPRIKKCMKNDLTLIYAGRKRSASPAVGSPHIHKQEQETLVVNAFNSVEKE